MKIRNNFVSNSSSCSFIISAPKNIDKQKFADDLLNELCDVDSKFHPVYDQQEYRDYVKESLKSFKESNRERIIDAFSTKIDLKKDTNCELFDSKFCGFYDKEDLISELSKEKEHYEKLQKCLNDNNHKERYKKEYLYYIEDEDEKNKIVDKSIRYEISYSKYRINAIENMIKDVDNNLIMVFPINYEGNGLDGDGLNLARFNSNAFKKYNILYYFQG